MKATPPGGFMTKTILLLCFIFFIIGYIFGAIIGHLRAETKEYLTLRKYLWPYK